MAGVVRMSEAAAIGLHALGFLAAHPKKPAPTREIASSLKVSVHHLSKVLQRLSRAGLVRSVPGPSGGFTLTRRASRITLLEAYEAIEGPLTYCDCLLDRRDCPLKPCTLGLRLGKVHAQIRRCLEQSTVARLARLGRTTRVERG